MSFLHICIHLTFSLEVSAFRPKIRGRDLHMHKSILALATAGALAGSALPALSWDRDDNDGYYRHRNYHDYNYSYAPTTGAMTTTIAAP